jgi:repressor of nif and glnA expression
MGDLIGEEIFKLIVNSEEPLDTKEIEEKIKNKAKKESVTRTKIFYRLNLLRGEGKIKGKFIRSGKGVWVWWVQKMFEGRGNEK